MLEFRRNFIEKTGELGNCSVAYYKGLKFKVYEPSIAYPIGRVTFEGSLHKYWNNGLHNFNDFGVREVLKVIGELHNYFGFHPNNCVIRQIELGVNIKPSIGSKSIIYSCFMHGTKRFGWQSTKDEGAFIQVVRDRKTLKLYDKACHYRTKGFLIPDEVLRFEVKFTKMQELNKENIYSLSDIINFGLSDLTKNILLREWGGTLVYDASFLKGHKNQKDYANPLFWIDLAKTSSSRFKYHRTMLNNLCVHSSMSIKNLVAQMITEKIASLS